MGKLSITVKGMELKVEGSAEMIRRERKAFFSYLEKKDRESAEAMRKLAYKVAMRRPEESADQLKDCKHGNQDFASVTWLKRR